MFRLSLVAGALFLSACGVETPEDVSAWDALEALERAAALACANVPSSSTSNVGDVTCQSGSFGPYAKPQADGSCPPGYTAGTATTSNVCDVAEGLLAEPGNCPTGCKDGGVSGVSPTNSSAKSCTVSQYRECSPRPAQETEFEASESEV